MTSKFVTENTNETKKMFRAIINAQSAMKSELITKIDRLDEKLTKRIDALDGKLDRVEDNLTKRIDKIGLQVARLEDDTPTREEFENLNLRVDSLATP